MKKMNNKGFTLIELLAVITIMGILMLVAIPAISRTIENSRRDTFANTAEEYIRGVSNAVSSDELKCNVSGSATIDTMIAAVPAGTYYVNIDTKSGETYAQQTQDLMEQGGKYSWSNADVKGYVEITKATAGNRTTYTYKILLVDSGNHGIGALAAKPVKRTNVTAVATTTYANVTHKTATTSVMECKLDV